MQILGFTFDKLLLIFMLAAFLIGPKQLPVYARKIGVWLGKARAVSESAKQHLVQEMGEITETEPKSTPLVSDGASLLSPVKPSSPGVKTLSYLAESPGDSAYDDEAT